MAKTSTFSFRSKFLLLFSILLIASTYSSKAQTWQEIRQKAKEIKEAARAAKEAAKEIKNTSKELNNTVKSFKTTWTKDTSSNIKFRQIPDYRKREEVNINKKQKLIIENGEFKNLLWNPVLFFDNQLFPSFIIGYANYKGEKTKDKGSSLGFNISTSLKNIVLKWEIECAEKDFFSIDSGYVMCDELKGSDFLPKINWNYKALVKHQANTPINFYFRLTDPLTGLKVEKLVNANLRSITDCLISPFDEDKRPIMILSYVNEDDIEDIDKIGREMLNTKMIKSISGYQEGEEIVDLQIAALWRVLHNKGIQYSSITENSFSNEEDSKIQSQTIRTIDMSLKTQQANCVDGTALFASALKRFGINPVLVTVPGHCFLAYYPNDSLNRLEYLETTMLSNSDYISNPQSAFSKFITNQSKEANDWESSLKILEKKNILTPEIKDLIKNRIKAHTFTIQSLSNIFKSKIFSNFSSLDKAYYLEYLAAKIHGKDNIFLNLIKQSRIHKIDVAKERYQIKPIPIYKN
jgi:hypothetical protein